MFDSVLQNRPSGVHMLYLLASVFLLSPLLYALYNVYLHPLSAYPGPPLWCAFRLRWVLALHTGDLHRILLQLHDTYGPVVRIAPNELSYTDPQAWKDIYQNPRVQRGKVWFPRLPGQPATILGDDEDAHARYKRAFMKGFGEEGLKAHVGTMEQYVGIMMKKWKAMIQYGEGEAELDLCQWLDMLTFDVSGDLCFGSSFGSTEKGEPHPWVQISTAFGKGVALTASLNFYPGMVSLLRYATPKKVRDMFIYHRQMTTEKVRDRLALPTARNDFVQSVLDWNREKGQRAAVSEEEVIANMPIILFAGSETTSAALSCTFWHLLRSPVWYERLVKEIGEAFNSEEEITAEAASKLEILTAVINEGMRLGPPSVVGVPRCVTSRSGEMVCGRHVPFGTMLAVSQYPTGRSAMNFERPEEFDPGRFLDGREKSDFRPFLLGRHVCLGEKFAWMEMRLVMARVLWGFDLVLDEGGKGARSWGEQKTFIFWQKEKLVVRIRARH